MFNELRQENKLTVGFRCSPQTKIRLMREATQNGVSLSEYLESLITNLETSHNTDEAKISPEIQLRIDKLTNRIIQYETPTVKKLFQDAKANPNNTSITDLPDLVNIIIQSYVKTL